MALILSILYSELFNREKPEICSFLVDNLILYGENVLSCCL